MTSPMRRSRNALVSARPSLSSSRKTRRRRAVDADQHGALGIMVEVGRAVAGHPPDPVGAAPGEPGRGQRVLRQGEHGQRAAQAPRGSAPPARSGTGSGRGSGPSPSSPRSARAGRRRASPCRSSRTRRRSSARRPCGKASRARSAGTPSSAAAMASAASDQPSKAAWAGRRGASSARSSSRFMSAGAIMADSMSRRAVRCKPALGPADQDEGGADQEGADAVAERQALVIGEPADQRRRRPAGSAGTGRPGPATNGPSHRRAGPGRSAGC